MRLNNIQFNKDKLFFTSDTHFGHTNIIKYCDRPFISSIEMNQELVKRWNEKISKDDIVFHLGDFALGLNSKDTAHILNSLNGKKYLIIGNHEKCALAKEYVKSLWEGIYDIAEITITDEEIGEQRIFMCHYPMITWNGSHRGSWQLFGHVHGGLSNKGEIKHSPSQMDVGVDCHNYAPLSYQEVKTIITKQHLA